jgi:hypothetical protein
VSGQMRSGESDEEASSSFRRSVDTVVSAVRWTACASAIGRGRIFTKLGASGPMAVRPCERNDSNSAVDTALSALMVAFIAGVTGRSRAVASTVRTRKSSPGDRSTMAHVHRLDVGTNPQRFRSDYASSTMAFWRTPTRSTSMSTMSPAFIQIGGFLRAPIPPGVPVTMTSPGSSGAMWER